MNQRISAEVLEALDKLNKTVWENEEKIEQVRESEEFKAELHDPEFAYYRTYDEGMTVGIKRLLEIVLMHVKGNSTDEETLNQINFWQKSQEEIEVNFNFKKFLKDDQEDEKEFDPELD